MRFGLARWWWAGNACGLPVAVRGSGVEGGRCKSLRALGFMAGPAAGASAQPHVRPDENAVRSQRAGGHAKGETRWGYADEVGGIPSG